jgi:hypothetical protein
MEAHDVGLSDHHFLRWSAALTRPQTVYKSTTSRPWRCLSASDLRTGLLSSSLCCPDLWTTVDIDGLAKLYNTEITAILDQLVPFRTVRRRLRPSDPWFDEECRDVKRLVRKLERAARSKETHDAVLTWITQRKAYRLLLQQKREMFWLSKITAERLSPQQLWKSIDTIMGRGQTPTTHVISADTFHNFFDDKVSKVRASTIDAPAPVITVAQSINKFAVFQCLTISDVMNIIKALPDKQCESDPLPTHLLKDCSDILAPFVCELFNRSLSSGQVPAMFKLAYITPLLKKAT